MRIIKLTILLFLAINSNIFAQNISVKSSLDTNVILIGDQINYNLTLTKPIDSKIGFPNLADTLTEKILIISKDTIDTLKINNDNITLKQSYKITCFDSGYYAIPPAYFIQQQDTTIDTIAITNPLLLQVLTFKVDTTKQKIADIKDIYDAPMTFMEFLQEYYPYIIIAVIVISLIIAVIIYIKKHKQKPEEKPRFVKPKEPAHVIAFRELQKLQDQKLWQKNKVKLYYVNLTEIIRKYIEYRFEVIAMEQTSSEIIDALEPIIKDKATIKYLQDLFYTADLVKFAKYKPLPNEHDLSYKNAYNFIDITKITEVNNKQQDEN